MPPEVVTACLEQAKALYLNGGSEGPAQGLRSVKLDRIDIEWFENSGPGGLCPAALRLLARFLDRGVEVVRS